MNTTNRFDLYAAGMAIFAMFFGAGNIIFPLALGQFALGQTPYALAGLLITAVAMPFIGLLTMFLYQSQVSAFFGRLGKHPGLLISCFTIALLGPLGCAPRCIALAHATLSVSIPNIPIVYYAAASCLLIFFFVCKKNNLLKVIGYVLSPIKVVLLISIIIIGFISLPSMIDANAIETFSNAQSDGQLFIHGLVEGYKTMDLIGAIFFAPIIAASLIQKDHEKGVSPFILKACGIGAALLAIVYVGFCFLAYFYAPVLVGVSSDRLLGAIAVQVLGPSGAIIVSLTVAVACLTTAVALIGAFSSFVQKEIFSDRIGYMPIVIVSLATTFGMTLLGFKGIAAFIDPALEMLYPVLIGLTVYNLLHYFLFSRRRAAVELET